MSGQPLRFIAQRARRDGSDLREVSRRCLTATGQHHVSPFAVIIFTGVDAAHQAQVVHLLGRVWAAAR